jgi:hypothetical protein
VKSLQLDDKSLRESPKVKMNIFVKQIV